MHSPMIVSDLETAFLDLSFMSLEGNPWCPDSPMILLDRSVLIPFALLPSVIHLSGLIRFRVVFCDFRRIGLNTSPRIPPDSSRKTSVLADVIALAR